MRALRSRGGRLLLRAPVESILQGPRGAAAGVVLRGGGVVRARKAVISNASTWDTLKLVPPDALLPEFKSQVRTRRCLQCTQPAGSARCQCRSRCSSSTC